ncbi:MAG: hypothetical protein K9M57_06865, partial [Phycisphaerae bacterium]|nr:hypothetical protein [Phycisphaerae bacterium]
MTKRIILLVASFLGVCLILLIFRQLNKGLESGPSGPDYDDHSELPYTGSDDENIIKVSDGSGVGGIDGGFIFTKPGKYSAGFQRRVSENENKLEFSQPWVNLINKKNGQVIRITAKSLWTAVNDFKQGSLPKRGTLQDDVRLLILKPTDKETTSEKGLLENQVKIDNVVYDVEIQIEMDSIIYEQEFSQVTTNGPVNITSPEFSAAGRYLNMQYDQINNRLQFLELLELKHLIFAKNLDELSSKRTDKPDEGSLSKNNNLSIKKSKSKIATYSLDILDDVVIVQGQRKLMGDSINILADFDPTRSFKSDTDKAPNKADKTPEAGQGSILKDQEDDPDAQTIITASGPLRITSLENIKPLGNDQKRLQLTIKGNPVKVLRDQDNDKVWGDDELAIQADEIIYNDPNETMKLTGSPQRAVWLSLGTTGQFAQAQKINVNLKDKLATLHGPGQANYDSTEKGEGGNKDKATAYSVNYSDKMEIHFSPSATQQRNNDPGDDLGGMPVDRIKTYGLTEIVDGDTTITTHGTLMTFYPEPESTPAQDKSQVEKNSFLLKTLQITQCMVIDPNSDFSCDHFTANFDLDESGRSSQLARIQTLGKLHTDSPEYHIEIIQSMHQQDDDPNMLLVFEPRPPVKDPNAQPEKKKNTGSLAGMGDLFGRSQLVSANIDAPGGKIILKDKVNHFAVTSEHIDGDGQEGDIMESGLWNITGPNSVIELADHGRLLGDKIILDLARGDCNIPGEGSMKLKSKTSLTGEQIEKPTDIQVRWAQGALYSTDSETMTFQKVTTEITGETKAGPRVSVLTCPEMVITLETPDDPIQERTPENIAAPSKPLGRATEKRKELNSLTAFGTDAQPVHLVSRQFDRPSGSLTSLMQMQVKTLNFDKKTEILLATGKGWIDMLNTPVQKIIPDTTVENTEMAVANGATAPNIPDNSLSSLLSNSISSGSGYTLVHFLDEMEFDIKKENIHFTHGIAMHQMPLLSDPNNEGSPLAPPAFSEKWPKGRSQLFCNDLKVVSQSDPNSPLADPDSVSHLLGEIGYVRAEGNVVFETAPEDFKRIFFTSDSITINNTH